jgi:hypothetical protein
MGLVLRVCGRRLGALSVNWVLDEADLVGDNNLDWMTPR